MDFILLKSDGNIKQTNFADFIQQNNDGVNKIFVSCEDLDYSSHSAVAVFVLPDGSISEEPGVYQEDVEYKDDHFANGYLITLTQNETKLAGLVFLTINIKNISANTSLYTYRATITINKTADQANITYITLAQDLALKDYVDTTGRPINVYFDNNALVMEEFSGAIGEVTPEYLESYYVPYTSANKNVNIGNHKLNAGVVTNHDTTKTKFIELNENKIYYYDTEIDDSPIGYVTIPEDAPQDGAVLATQEWVQSQKPNKNVIGTFNTSNFVVPTGADYYQINNISLSGQLGDLITITWGNAFALCPVPSLMDLKGESLIDGSYDDDYLEDNREVYGSFSLLGHWTLDQLYPTAEGYLTLYGNDDVTLHLTNGQIQILEYYTQDGQDYTKVKLHFTTSANFDVLCPGFDGTFDLEEEEVWQLIQKREGHVVASLIGSDGTAKIVKVKYEITDNDSKLSITTDSSFIPPSNYTGYVINYKII